MKYLVAKHMKHSVIIAGAFLLAALVVFVVASPDHNHYDSTASYQDKFGYWKTRIHAIGGHRAYEELAGSLKDFPLGIQHSETHIFSTALYSEEGMQGIAVCDERFDYACSHQMIGETFADLGMGSFPYVVEICKGIPTCLHSIGHGVLSLQGYSFNDLQKAITICGTLPTETYMKGCYGGVFMEYNLHKFLGDGLHVRPVGKNWLAPCDEFSGVLGRICYYWQPTWWANTPVSNDLAQTTQRIRRMGELCETLSRPELKASCFAGVAVVVRSAGRNTGEAVSACFSVSSEMSNQAQCRTGVARLAVLLGSFDEALAVCLELPRVYQDGCLEVIKNANPSESFTGLTFPME